LVIGVDIHAAVFLEANKPQPLVLYELVKGWLTGTEPEHREDAHTQAVIVVGDARPERE